MCALVGFPLQPHRLPWSGKLFPMEPHRLLRSGKLFPMEFRFTAPAGCPLCQRFPACNSFATASRPATAQPQRPGQQLIPDGFRHGAPASNSSATAFQPATASPRRPGQQHLRYAALDAASQHGASASNKPHLAEKSAPVWLAIWHIWAGFANSQHRDAAFATPKNICAHSSSLPHWAAAQTDANLSAHLHRLPTPPPYLRPMRLLHGRVRRCWVLDEAVASQGRRYWMANDAAAWPRRRCWIADAAAGCPWSSSCKSPRARILVLGTSGAHWPARWPRFELTERVAKS